jgi:amphi-Trp domain-containing protein
MASRQPVFHHSSLQDADSVVELLQALTKGLSDGKLQLSDEDAAVVLRPRGLLEVVVDAEDDAGINTLNLRIRWNDAGKKLDRRTLKIR